MKRVAVYAAWLAAWWAMPAACLLLKGRYINFLGMMLLVATTTSIAGYLHLWPPAWWLEKERQSHDPH